MAGILRWSVKLGAVGGALYLASTEKFFGTTKETADAYGRLKAAVTNSGYVQMLPEAPEMPKELSDGLGSIREYRRGFKQHWNDGVVFVFGKIAASPEYMAGLAASAKDLINSQAEAGGSSSAEEQKKEKEGDKSGDK